MFSRSSSTDTACADAGNAAGREAAASSAPTKLSAEPLRPLEMDQRAEQTKRHPPESKTAETELTVVTVVPVTRYLPANNASQEVVTPTGDRDVGTPLSLKVPVSPAKVSAYGGDRPIPALIRSEYFRASAERGSLSLSRSFSSSELDYDRAQQKEAHAGDGRRVLGATLTLRQVYNIRVCIRLGGYNFWAVNRSLRGRQPAFVRARVAGSKFPVSCRRICVYWRLEIGTLSRNVYLFLVHEEG